VPATVRYVVERLYWTPWEHYGVRWDGHVRLPGSTPLAEFATEEEALADCARRDAELRARLNPFACGGPALHYQTRFDEDRLHDWVLDAGLEPPVTDRKTGRRDWRAWWEATRPAMTPAQVEHCWQAFDRLLFHQVRTRGAGRTVFVVVRREWEYNDNWMEALAEGGKAVQLYSRREDAEAALALLEEEARAENPGSDGWGEGLYGGWEITARLSRLDDPFQKAGYPGDVFARADEPVFYEIVEVELDPPEAGGGHG
jgi:hypothetical protein